MSFSVNRVTLVGHITKEIELVKTPQGRSVANIFMVTSRGIKRNNVWEDKPTFFKIVAWDRMAEFAKNNLTVNDRLYVEGRIESDSFEDPETKKKRTYLEIIARNIIPMSKKLDPVKSPQSEVESVPNVE